MSKINDGLTLIQIMALAANTSRKSPIRSPRKGTRIYVKTNKDNDNHKTPQMRIVIVGDDMKHFVLGNCYQSKYIPQFNRLYFLPDENGNKYSKNSSNSCQITFSDFTVDHILSAAVQQIEGEDGILYSPICIDTVSEVPYIEISKQEAANG